LIACKNAPSLCFVRALAAIMRINVSDLSLVSPMAVACLFLAASLAGAEAGEISRLHRGAWAKNGDCKQAQRIIIGEKTIKLVERGRVRTLTDGEEAVFKGKTLINASLAAKKEEDAVLAFSGRLSEAAGQLKLVSDGLENGGFSGTFVLCKGPVSRIGRVVSYKPKLIMRKKSATRTAWAQHPVHHFARPNRALLGGFY
jgi:hypothetical protein